MKIKVTVEVPGGQYCGMTSKGECRFLAGNGTLTTAYCDLFYQLLETIGRHYKGVLKCSDCLNAEVVEDADD